MALIKHAMRQVGARLCWQAPAQAPCIPIWKEWVHHAKQRAGQASICPDRGEWRHMQSGTAEAGTAKLCPLLMKCQAPPALLNT